MKIKWNGCVTRRCEMSWIQNFLIWVMSSQKFQEETKMARRWVHILQGKKTKTKQHFFLQKSSRRRLGRGHNHYKLELQEKMLNSVSRITKSEVYVHQLQIAENYWCPDSHYLWLPICISQPAAGANPYSSPQPKVHLQSKLNPKIPHRSYTFCVF